MLQTPDTEQPNILGLQMTRRQALKTLLCAGTAAVLATNANIKIANAEKIILPEGESFRAQLVRLERYSNWLRPLYLSRENSTFEEAKGWDDAFPSILDGIVAMGNRESFTEDPNHQATLNYYESQLNARLSAQTQQSLQGMYAFEQENPNVELSTSPGEEVKRVMSQRKESGLKADLVIPDVIPGILPSPEIVHEMRTVYSFLRERTDLSKTLDSDDSRRRIEFVGYPGIGGFYDKDNPDYDLLVLNLLYYGLDPKVFRDAFIHEHIHEVHADTALSDPTRLLADIHKLFFINYDISSSDKEVTIKFADQIDNLGVIRKEFAKIFLNCVEGYAPSTSRDAIAYHATALESCHDQGDAEILYMAEGHKEFVAELAAKSTLKGPEFLVRFYNGLFAKCMETIPLIMADGAIEDLLEKPDVSWRVDDGSEFGFYKKEEVRQQLQELRNYVYTFRTLGVQDDEIVDGFVRKKLFDIYEFFVNKIMVFKPEYAQPLLEDARKYFDISDLTGAPISPYDQYLQSK